MLVTVEVPLLITTAVSIPQETFLLSNSTLSSPPMTSLYRSLNLYFLNWYLPLVLCIGVIGSIFCVFFILYSGFFSRSLMLWLLSICVGDFMILLWDGGRMMVKSIWGRDLRDDNLGLCFLHLCLSNYFLYWSPYMQATMSLHRCYYIIRPLRARTHLTMRRLWAVWWGISLAMWLPMIPYPVYWRLKPDGDCQPTSREVYYITTVLDTLVLGCVPLSIMVCTTVAIVLKMVTNNQDFHVPNTTPQSSSQNNLYRISVSGVGEQTPQLRKPLLLRVPQRSQSLIPPSGLDDTLTTTPPPTVPFQPSPSKGQRHGGTLSSRNPTRHVTRLLLTMNVWYFVTTFPMIVYFLHLNFRLGNRVGETISRDTHQFCYYLLRSLCYLNCSFNWFFYCFSSAIFRNRVKELFSQAWKQQRRRFSHSTSQSSTGWLPAVVANYWDGSNPNNANNKKRNSSIDFSSSRNQQWLHPSMASGDGRRVGSRYSSPMSSGSPYRPRAMSYAFEPLLSTSVRNDENVRSSASAMMSNYSGFAPSSAASTKADVVHHSEEAPLQDVTIHIVAQSTKL